MSLSRQDDALSPEQVTHLTDCETIIAAGLASFVEVGEALADVRDSRLYRAEFATFEDYCTSRWGLTDRRARQLMTSARTGTMVPVENERQARALAPLAGDAEQANQAWQAANETAEAEGRKVTASDVAGAVAAIVTPSQPAVPAPSADEAEPEVSPASGSAPITITKTTTEKTVIDGETGEILERPDMADLVDPALVLRRDASRAVERQAALLRLDPRAVADALLPDDRSTYLRLAGEMARWSRLLTEALSVTNLRRVK